MRLVAAATTVLSGLAIIFVGGEQYAAIQDSLWAFALLGGLLAMLQILVYGVMARQARKSVYLLWAGCCGWWAWAHGRDLRPSCRGSCWAWTPPCSWLLTATSLWSLRTRQTRTRGRAAQRHDGSVSGGVPAVPGAHGDVEGNGQRRG